MGDIHKYGYAANWAQVKPLIEDGAEGIGLIKIEDQFLLEDPEQKIRDGAQALKDGHILNASNPFFLDRIFGSDLLFYYVLYLQSLNFFQKNTAAENILSTLQSKFEKELAFYTNLNFSSEKNKPFALRLLDPEIVFSRYMGNNLQTTFHLVTYDIVQRVGRPFLSAIEPLTHTFNLLSKFYRTKLRGSTFCVAMPELTAFQIYSALDAITEHRNPNSDTAIVLPYVENKEIYQKFFTNIYKPVIEQYKKQHPDKSRHVDRIRPAITIESMVTENDIKSFFDNSVSWFLFGTNDLTASILQSDRFSNWGENEIYKSQLHPKVMDAIKKIHQTIASLASNSSKPIYVGYAGEPSRAAQSTSFLEEISKGDNIIYYRIFRGQRQICSNTLVTYKGDDFAKLAINPSDNH